MELRNSPVGGSKYKLVNWVSFAIPQIGTVTVQRRRDTRGSRKAAVADARVRESNFSCYRAVVELAAATVEIACGHQLDDAPVDLDALRFRRGQVAGFVEVPQD